MLSKARRVPVHRLLFKPSYGLLDHQQMEGLKKQIFEGQGKAWRLKLQFILKEAKYTLVQGSKDLWTDSKWFFGLYRRKQRQYFTGYEIS
jgi:hypothetical protein